MAFYTMTNNGNVVEVLYKDLGKYHDVYSGSYKDAVKYFGVKPDEVKSYGRLIDVVIYRQTSLNCKPLLSNELFDKLVYIQSQHKYWCADPEKRIDNALEAIDKAKKWSLIFDDDIIANLKRKSEDESISRRKQLDYLYRINAYEKWKKDYRR